jgi:Excalibur calcium-binding domain
MRRLVFTLALVALAACTQAPEDRTSNTLPTVTTVLGTSPTTATTRPPKPTTSRLALVQGKYCAAMRAAGWSFDEARAYYEDHGQPAHMDADGDGIPCETVYGEVGGPTPAPQQDCDPSYPDDCLPSPPPDLDCADIGHPVAVDHDYGDPHRLDADGDGYGCERYG